MKRLVFVVSSLLVLPAFAEVAPSFDDTELLFSDVDVGDVDTGAVETEIATDDTNVMPVQKSAPTVRSARTNTMGRATTLRSGVAQPRTTATRTTTTPSRNISGRGTTTATRSGVAQTRSANTSGQSSRATSNTPGVRARVSTITSTTPVYNANPVVQSRVSTVRPLVVSTRGATIRSASVTPTTVAETAAATTTELDAMKSLTEYCQAQYASCMDNYCNVLDDNQGRCSCSKNIANYEKTEAALAAATEALQDVARSIQYIGLPADQITTLFAETEAELAMKNAKDSSAIRSSLDKVKRMIVDVKSGTATSSETTGSMNFDLSGLLDFDISSTGFDLSSLLATTSSNTNSISNQRGESLYKTAASRCKASVLNSCVAQGVDAAVVTNSYDLEIDKACLAYERALTDSNTQMTQTVANAKEVLKKARLMVAQNKNSYDLRGCVSALESCMQDDYVCGNGYEGCLDPTGQYIVNGAVVIGSMPGNNTDVDADPSAISHTYSHDNLFSTWETSNNKTPWADSTNNDKYISLISYIDGGVNLNAAQSSSDKIIAYLQNKIGWHDSKTNKDYGMCMSVLNKCQNYTYDSKGKYKADNEVIKQFLQRSLVQIKMAQDELLASYAEDCVSDVSSCLTSNNYEADRPESAKSRTAINSCYSQIKTCMSVNGNVFGSVSPDALRTWVTGTYSSIETFTNETEIIAYCQTLDDKSTCEQRGQRGYCLHDNGSMELIKDSSGNVVLCQWNGTETAGSCTAVASNLCSSSSN